MKTKNIILTLSFAVGAIFAFGQSAEPRSGYTRKSSGNVEFPKNLAVNETLLVGYESAASSAPATLQLVDTTNVLLLPRLSDTHISALSGEVGGLLTYNSTQGALYYYNGIESAWLKVGASNLVDTIASAAALTLTETVNYQVTGTADITSISTSSTTDNFSVVHLLFTGTAASTGVTDGNNLKLAGSFAYSPDDILTLQLRDAVWYEVSRSAN